MGLLSKSKKHYSSINIIFIVLLSIISLFYLTIFQKYIPNKYYSDSDVIKDGLYFPNLFGKSTKNTSVFFHYIGFNYFTPMMYVHIFSWLVLVFILITVLRINGFRDFSFFQILLIISFVLMYGCYFGHYSKDIICLLFFAIAMNIHFYRSEPILNIVLTIGLYGCIFRTYWLIIFVIAIIFLFINRKHMHINIKKDILYLFLMIIIVIIIYDILHHSYLTNVKVNVNTKLLNLYGSNIHATISNLLTNSSIITDCINYIYSLITLIIPIQGFSSFNVIIYYLWIFYIISICIVHKRHMRWKILLILIIYLNVQALFEPNFGSVLRHQLAWFPVLYYSL